MIDPSARRLIQSASGYWTYALKPSADELTRYYSTKYYQEPKGSYSFEYTEEEIKHRRLMARLIMGQFQRLRPHIARSRLLDVGCGEGWLLNEFFQKGHQVMGLDFSDFGVERFHSHLKPYIEKGNFEQALQGIENNNWDFVALANVIEHVRDPEALLGMIRPLLNSHGLLMIKAPNDNSPLHQYLLDGGFIKEPFWFLYPDHLSYFNKKSMEALLIAKGFKIEAVVSDNPIDLNLLNDNSNYVTDPAKGKNTHWFRVRTDNFLAGMDEGKLLDLYTLLGSMGVGRNLHYYCSVL